MIPSSRRTVGRSKIARRLTRIFVTMIIMTMIAGHLILGGMARSARVAAENSVRLRAQRALRAEADLLFTQGQRLMASETPRGAASARFTELHSRIAGRFQTEMDHAFRADPKEEAGFIGVTLIVTVFCCFVGWFFATLTAARFARPVLRLAEAAREIADGHLEKRVDEDAPDEIADLAVAFNRMTAALQASRSELRDANARLEVLASQDGLTGLYNRRTFQERLAHAWERAMRTDAVFSLILLDVDKFKTYNDTYGHLAGDAVLKTVARILQETARGADFVARYGGEEFVVVLIDTDAAEACHAAEAFRAAIERHDWPERAVTASLGIATVTPAITDTSHLIAAADEALYQAKDAGRNRAVHAQMEVGLIDPVRPPLRLEKRAA